MDRVGALGSAGAARAALASFWLAACAPAASQTPLGLGPLALAEKNAPVAAPVVPEPSAANEPGTKAAPAPREGSTTVEETTPTAAEESGTGAEAASPDPTANAGDFEGMYSGDDIAVFRLPGFPESEQRDERAKIRIEDAGAGSVSITLINSDDGSDLCELNARVDGNAALIESPQPCFTGGGEGSPEAVLTSGRAVLSGDQLRMDAEGTLSLALPDQELDGELTYSFKGKRE